MKHSTAFIILCALICSILSFWVCRGYEKHSINEKHLLKELVLRGRLDTCQIQSAEFEKAYIQAITPLPIEDLRAGLGLPTLNEKGG